MSTEVVAGPAAAWPQERRIKAPSPLRCGMLLLAVRTMLRIRGFRRTLAWAVPKIRDVPTRRTVDLDIVRATEHAVALAGAFYPGRALCLEQSLVLCHLLRREGVDVTYCQGVQAHPFLAHAWVEYQGTPVNDVEEHVRRFVRLAAEPR